MRGTIGWIVSCAVVLTFAAAFPLPAQQPADETEVGNIHFAFATYLGSGIYSVGDTTVQVYRIPYTLGILPEEGRDWGLNLQLSATFGFYDFKAEDVLVVGLPERVSTISFVPSLRAPLRLTKQWTVTPNADLGAAKDRDRGDLVWVYGLGLQGEAIYPMANYDLRPLLRGLWAHHSGDVVTIGNDMAKFEAGLEIRAPMRYYLFGQRLDFGVFGKYYAYVHELELVETDNLPVDYTNQWEVGASIGTVSPLKFLGATMPRLGLSYRFGENVGAVRIILGRPM